MSSTTFGGSIAAVFAAVCQTNLPPKFFERLEREGHAQRRAHTWPDLHAAITSMRDARSDWEA